MSSDDQYTALGPAEVGFQTNGANIQTGAALQGVLNGVVATAFNGDFGAAGVGVRGITYQISPLPPVLGVEAGVLGEGSGSPGIHGVYGRAGSSDGGAGSGVLGENLDDGEGVKGTSVFGTAVYGRISNPVSGNTAVIGSTLGTGSGVWGAIENPASTSPGVFGTTDGRGPGVQGTSSAGPGGQFSSPIAQIELTPANGAHPVIGSAGQLFVDASLDLWCCKGGANWVRIV